jgi:hypothetical protein
MRTSVALLASALLAAPSVLALPEQEWWPTTTKHWTQPPHTWEPETSDCETSTSHWKPPPPPETTSCSDEEETTTYSSPYESETTVTISITSCPGGCVGTTYTSTSYPAPTSTGYGLSLTVAPTTSYSVPAPSSTMATYSAPNTTTSLTKPTLTVPLGGAAQKGFSFSAVMVGVVGVLFAML